MGIANGRKKLNMISFYCLEFKETRVLSVKFVMRWALPYVPVDYIYINTYYEMLHESNVRSAHRIKICSNRVGLIW